MLRYQTRRHRYLMQESEQALNDAAETGEPRQKRIAQHVLNEPKILSLWETRHAELLVPVAERRSRANQIFNMRDIEVKLLHRRALIRAVRELGITGPEREKLFSSFYGPRDVNDAIVAEHKQYTLAVSSHLSTEHLIDVMGDPVSERLIRIYTDMYTKYFEYYCKSVMCSEPAIVELYREQMLPLRNACLKLLKRLHTETPAKADANLEKQLLLARSGRYPIQNYMVG
ncbi:MAG: hypothetical protein AAGA61_01640 [Pseudomonadota bacterium]